MKAMDKSASTTIVDQQNIAATAQKSKKKSKNKKANDKVITSPNSSPNGVPTAAVETMNNGEKVVKEVAGDIMNAANGLTKKFEQNLHIAGDGLQTNGITSVQADKCNNSQIDSHVAQNGYHNPAVSANATTRNLGALKKSKSKSNKQPNKETHLAVECASNEVSAAALHKSTNTDLLHLKNGFHVCKLESSMPCDEQIQQSATVEGVNKTLTETLESQQMHPKNSKALNLTTAAQYGEAPAFDATMSDASLGDNTRLPPDFQTLATIATTHSNNNTNANTPTATIQNTNINKIKENENTANQDEDNSAQQAVANSSTVTTCANEETTTTTMLSVSTPSSVVNATTPPQALDLCNVHIEYKEYESELQMHDIMRLIQAELSEPYSIYTYRYFIYNWPKLCFLAAHGNEYVGAIVCKLDMHMNVRRGYIAMLAVRKEYRKLKIGTTLVQKAIEAMLADNADEVVLETEMRNVPALRLYENLGFVRDKRLFRYYLNGVDALRLKLWFR